MICAHRDGGSYPQALFPSMTLPPENTSQQLKRLSTPRTVILETLAFPERGRDEDGKDDVLPMASFVPQVNVEGSGSSSNLMSARAWRNHAVWRAGASILKSNRTSTNYRFLFVCFQVIEGVASGTLNFVSGLLVATLSTWPLQVVPVGVLFGNTILVSLIISATASATGGHINSMVTLATAFSGLCHPVRAIIYISCQLVGGALGGALLRVALGKRLAYEIHNAGCWIEPKGEVDVWQATLIEFTSAFILLSVMLSLVYQSRSYLTRRLSLFTPGSWVTG